MPAIGLAPLLGIVFIVLKLTEVIAWSWLWVLAPFWIPALITVIVLFFMFVAAAYAARKTEEHPLWEHRAGVDRLRDRW